MADSVAGGTVPYFALVGSKESGRWLTAWGSELNTVAHGLGDDQRVLVDVCSRTTGRKADDGSRLPITEQLALEYVATGLALARGIDNAREAMRIGRELAAGETAWRRTTLTMDGECVDALDCTFEGYFALAHLTPELIVSVIGPTMLRPDNVELISISAPTRMEPPPAP
jgi:hypothetical protein